jgi:parvulin-like peptidyl-prolyl isomerase
MGFRTAALRARTPGFGLVALCLMPGSLVSGCRARPERELAATYEGGRITRDEYQSWLAYAKLEDDPAQRTARLGRIALGHALSAELLAHGGDREPAVAGQLADLEDRVLSQALERRVQGEVRVSDAEVEQALRENDADRHQPRRLQLANLFKRVPRDATPAERRATRARMEELRRQLLAGADFAELARRESDSQTRFRGGRMGIAGPGQLPPQLEKVAFQLGEGELSGVLEHPEGFTLLKCLRIFPERTMPVEEARQKLRQHLESKADTRHWEEVLSAALARWPLVVEMSADAVRSAEPSRVVARFGERAVARADVRRWLGGGVERLGGEELGDEALRAFLLDRARLHAAAKRARELGLETVPEVGAQLGWGRLHILATEEMGRRVRDAFQEPTEEELRARFESSRDRRVQPPRFRVSVLRFGWEDQPLSARSQRAEEVLARVRAGGLTFERAARELSTHASSSRGGDLGWLTSRALAGLGPSVLGTIKELAVGAVSPVVLQDNALWALLVTGRDEERPQTFEEARQDLRRELGNERTNAIQKRIEDRMLAKLHLQLR